MSRPERKASRILLKYGIVGDYDGAYDWVDSNKHTDPDYSIGEHGGVFPSDRYTVIEVVDSDYVDNLETWFDAELKAAENDYKRYKKLKATNAALLDVVRDCVNFLADLNSTPEPNPEYMADRAKALHKRAYTAHSKAKEK